MTLNHKDWIIRNEDGEFVITCPLPLRRHPEFLAALPSVQSKEELAALVKKYAKGGWAGIS